MSYPSYESQRGSLDASLPQLPASRIATTDAIQRVQSADLFGTQLVLGQETFGTVLPGQEFMTSSQIPVPTQHLPSMRGPQASSMPLPMTGVPFGTQPLLVQGGMSPVASMQGIPGGSMSMPVARLSQTSLPGLDQPQGPQLSSLPAGRISQLQGEWQFEAASSPPPPASFTTAAVPQIQALDQESRVGGDDESEARDIQEELQWPQNQYLQPRAEQQDYQQQLPVASRRQSQTSLQEEAETRHASVADITYLQQRVAAAEENELRAHQLQANALQAHDMAVKQINELEQEIFRMRAQEGAQGGNPADGQRMVELQRQLSGQQGSQADAQRQLDEYRANLEEKSRELQLSRDAEAELRQQLHQQEADARGEVLRMETRLSTVSQRLGEQDTQQLMAEAQAAELHQIRGQHSTTVQELERKSYQLRNVEDTYQNQLLEERRKSVVLQDQLESETRSKEQAEQRDAARDDELRHLNDEVRYLKSCETFHKNQSEKHRVEVTRLWRLRQEDAPPKGEPTRMPFKALEERIMHLACFMMMGVCALPIMGAIATLTDENYQFWLGPTWPWLVIAGCGFVFILFAVTMQLLLNYSLPEHRSQLTMAFTWATFAALLGVILVPLSLLANKEALNIASTISQGCLTAMPQSEMLVDYSQVLYNIRLSPNCTGATSVAECQGYSANKYTAYLQYLEQDFHCGPLCPESPPPARAVHAPDLFTEPLPTEKPTLQPPPMYGPPLQNALSFLQADGSLVGQQVKLHSHEAARELAMPSGSGVMETALPHMQAKKLFSKGDTRMTCYPLIATRLQVLVSTFGGLWYWEGMGLIIISLLTSIYAGLHATMPMAA